MELSTTFLLISLYVVIEVAGIVTAIFSVLWARTSQGAAAWAVALITVPVFALPAFAIFGGRRFQGYVSKRKHSDTELGKEWKQFEKFFAKVRSFKKGENQTYDAFEALAGTPFTKAKSVKLLKDGEEFYPSLKAEIEKAQTFIDFQFYVFRDDEIGLEIADALMEKAQSGVKVRVLYDKIGSQQTKKAFFKKLKAAGVEVAPFISTRWLSHFGNQINFRNHRKLVNIDNHVLFVGGMNVGDDYLSKYPAIGDWRDTQLLIHGTPAVQAQHSFMADWFWSTREVVDFEAKGVPTEGEIPVLVLATSPVGIKESGSLAILNAIQAAEQRIWITTPYFVPDEQIVSALQLAVLRGVEVKILLAHKTDARLCDLASETFFDELIPCGVKIFKYPNGLMHQKVLLVDEDLSYVGSTNFDNRSFRLNFEIGAWVVEEKFAREVEKMLRTDFAKSTAVKMEDLKGMPFSQKVKGGFARLLAPAL
ncbi:MAG: cardiolipin synthase [Bdellovibrionota bacterium]